MRAAAKQELDPTVRSNNTRDFHESLKAKIVGQEEGVQALCAVNLWGGSADPPCLEAWAARLRAAGYRVVGENYENPAWRELFLHPKSAHGVLVQFAETLTP